MTKRSIEGSFRDVCYVLFRHKRKAIVFFLAVMGIITLATLITPKIYRSEAKIMVRLGRESVTLDPTATTGQTISVEQSRESEVKSELEILKSRELVEKVVDSIGFSAFQKAEEDNFLQKIFRGALEGILDLLKPLKISYPLSDREGSILEMSKNLEFEVLKNSNIISVSFEGKERRLAQEVVDKLLTFYLDKHIDIHKAAGSYQFFMQQTKQFGDTLAEVEENLQQLKNRAGIASLEEQRRILLKRIGDLQQEMEATEATLAASRKKIQTLKKTLAQLPETLVIQKTEGNPNQGVDFMRSKLFELRIKEQDLLSKYTDDSRPVREIRRQIGEAKALLEREDPGRTQVTTGINDAYKQVQMALLAERATFSSLGAKCNELRALLAKARNELRAINDSEMQLAKVQREMGIYETNYRKYYEKLEEARIDQAMEIGKISNIRVVQPPTYPLKSIRPKTILNLALGLLFGLCGGIGLAFFLDYMDHSFKSPEDVEEKLNLPALTTIPFSNMEVIHVQRFLRVL